MLVDGGEGRRKGDANKNASGADSTSFRTGARGVTRPGAPTAALGPPKTASFARFSRRFRGQSRPHGRIVQNGGKRFVTRASRVISVRSTGLAESCLTSQIGRDGVYSGSYERIMRVSNFARLCTASPCHEAESFPYVPSRTGSRRQVDGVGDQDGGSDAPLR